MEETDAALVREKQKLTVKQAKLKRRLETICNGVTTIEDGKIQNSMMEAKRPRSNSESSTSTISATEIGEEKFMIEYFLSSKSSQSVAF